jgi:hypothetical protein
MSAPPWKQGALSAMIESLQLERLQPQLRLKADHLSSFARLKPGASAVLPGFDFSPHRQGLEYFRPSLRGHCKR